MQPEAPVDSLQSGIPEYYINGTHLEVSAYDLAMTLSLMHSTARRDLVRVRMSPQHALILTALLMKNLSQYERLSGGPIPVLPDAIRNMNLDAALRAIRNLNDPDVRTE